MRIGVGLGWTGEPIGPLADLVGTAESMGVDSVWSLEEYGPDAVTVLGYLAARTSTIGLGTGIMQMHARTPAMTAMTALALDVLSGGRFRLGLGSSVPWLVEGWHGVPYGRPVRRSREFVAVLRQALARTSVEHEGDEFSVPYRGPGATGAKPMRTLAPAVRERIPILLAAIGPKQVALTGEVADGWLPGFYAPEHEAVLTAPLDEGARRAGRDPSDVDITVILQVGRADTVEEGRDFLRPLFAAYLGPPGPATGNPYAGIASRLGFEGAVARVQELYASGHKRDAVDAVPDAFIDAVSLVGPLPAIADRVAAYAESRVGTLVPVTEDLELLEVAVKAAG